MNIEEYISSGILELYAMGNLSPNEMEEVEQMARNHPDVQKELLLIEETMAAIAHKTALAPNPALRDRILNKLKTGEGNAALAKESDKRSPATLSRQEEKGSVLKFLLAASVAIAVLSSIAAITYWNKWQNTQSELKQTETELNEIITQNQEIAQNYEMVNKELQNLQSYLAITKGGDYQQIQMKGLAIAPAARASIYWNESTEETYLEIENLPETPSDKQFQLWAIVDGKPVSMGVFDVNGSTEGLKKMKDIANASAFAVTLEPRGGSESPTMNLMYVHGTVSES